MIYGFINNQEAVVNFGIFIEGNTRILFVVFFHILTELLGNLPVININRNTRRTFGQLHKHSVINIIVDNHNPMFRLFDSIGNKCISIENLPIEENTFLWFAILPKFIKDSIYFLVSL